MYAGLPLAFALWRGGAQVHLASLSFSQLELIDREAWVAEHVAAVQPDTTSPDWYFPERTLARWLAAQELPSTVYAFPPLGGQPLRAAYRHLVEQLNIDAVVLVDGGTDVLLRGDESDLGTPGGGHHQPGRRGRSGRAGRAGDQSRLRHRRLRRRQPRPGAGKPRRTRPRWRLPRCPVHPRFQPEAALYRDAVAHAQAATPDRPSIVQGQIAAATNGAFGDVRLTRRTGGGDLLVNPLMALYFTVDLDKLAARCLYLDRIENTIGRRQVITRIQAFRDELLSARIPRAFPY